MDWNLVQGLAALGALLALPLVWYAGLRRFFNDRPRLAVSLSHSIDRNGIFSAELTVTNRGWQPVTVTDAGIRNAEPPKQARFLSLNAVGEVVGHVSMARDELPKETPARGTIRLSGWFDEVPFGFNLDDRVYVYAQAVGQREARGSSRSPLFRYAVMGGWKPSVPLHPDYVASGPERVLIPRTVSRWKLWRPSHLRTSHYLLPQKGTVEPVGLLARLIERRRIARFRKAEGA